MYLDMGLFSEKVVCKIYEGPGGLQYDEVTKGCCRSLAEVFAPTNDITKRFIMHALMTIRGYCVRDNNAGMVYPLNQKYKDAFDNQSDEYVAQYIMYTLSAFAQDDIDQINANDAGIDMLHDFFELMKKNKECEALILAEWDRMFTTCKRQGPVFWHTLLQASRQKQLEVFSPRELYTTLSQEYAVY